MNSATNPARGDDDGVHIAVSAKSGKIWSVELTALQARVVACLIEKAATTPDSYPLTTNALVSACNQSTNRDPVVSYSDRDVDAAMIELREMKLARAVTGSGHRASKHKHVVDEALDLDGAQLAVLAVLLLRGPQTLKEIATRTERYEDGPAGDTDRVDKAIDALTERVDPLVERLQRRPGEREPRIRQLWQPSDDMPEPERSTELAEGMPDEQRPVARADDLADRVASLEAALAEQTSRLDALLNELGVAAPDEPAGHAGLAGSGEQVDE